MIGNIFKLHPEKVQTWLDWASYLKEHNEDVVISLEEEDLSFEGSFSFKMSEDVYVCLYAMPRDIGVKPTNLEREINRLHREKMKECFSERVSSLTDLYFFATNPRYSPRRIIARQK